MPVESFKCPQCGAPLTVPKLVTRCPYCGVALHVHLDEPQGGAAAENTSSQDSPAVEPAAVPQAWIPDPAFGAQVVEILSETEAASLAAELVALAARGQKIEAIKRYRLRTNEGLSAAKTAVERLEQNPSDPQVIEKLREGPHLPDQGILHSQALAEAVQVLAAEGKMDEAVAFYRKISGADAAEAKEVVYALVNSHSSSPAPDYGSGPSSLEASIRTLLIEGKKIEAIRLYRLKTYASLVVAKHAVESIEAGLSEEERRNLKSSKSFSPTACVIVVVLITILLITAALLTFLARVSH